jgi:DNA repair exonuclease SbcCD ATPase subunit
MMANSKHFILTIIMLLIVSPAGAQNTKLVNSFIRQGITLYEQGDINGAIDDLSRALLLDPHNAQAQSQLIKIIAHPSLDAKGRINLLVFEDLIDYTKKLKGKIEYVHFKNKLLEKDLYNKGYTPESLGKEMSRRKVFILDAQKKTPLKDRAILKNHDIPLEVVNANLNYAKKELNNKLVSLQNKYNFFRELNKEIPSDLSEFESLQDQLTTKALKSYYADQKEGIRTRKQDISSFTKDLIELKMKLQSQKLAHPADTKKMANLTEEIVDLSLKLAEKERALTDKVEEISSLNQEFIDLQERFKLEQKIIKEKDQQIHSLETKINEAHEKTNEWRAEFDKVLSQKTTKLSELNGIIDIYKEKLTTTKSNLKTQSADIITLEEQINSIQRELYDKDKFIEKTKDDLAYFETELINIKEGILNLKSYPRKAGYYNPEVVERSILELYAQIRDAQKYLLKQLQDFEKFKHQDDISIDE